LAVFGTAGSAWADYVYDHFNGDALDATKWTWDGTGSVTVADSAASIYHTYIGTTTDFGYGVYQVKFADAPTGTGNVGFAPADWSSQIEMRNDTTGNGSWELYVRQPDGGKSQVALATPAAGDVYTFDYSASAVKLFRNGSEVANVTTVFPVEGMGFAMGGGYGNNSFTMDYFAVGAIPEPSTSIILLTGLIGLLAYAWRKRR
jgi:hypothetical protein